MIYRTSNFLSVILLLASGIACATEIDSFNDRDPDLKDATAQINHMLNLHFKAAVQAANKKKSCDTRIIMHQLSDQLHGFGWSKIENEIVANEKIDKRQTPVKDSIYRDFSAFESPVFVVVNLGYVMRFGENYVGTDKFGHFFQEGYNMYRHIHVHENPTQGAVEHSEFTERTYYGLLTTGVYSFGDLASNYDGLLFWERVANTRLPRGVSPYFVCDNNNWSVNELFDINDYLNPAWDEGINCSYYRTADMQEKVDTCIANLERQKGYSFQCPIRPKECKSMIERYGNMASRVVTSKCFFRT